MRLSKKFVILMLIFVLLLSHAPSIVFAMQKEEINDLEQLQNEESELKENEETKGVQNKVQNDLIENQVNTYEESYNQNTIGETDRKVNMVSSENEQELTSTKYVVDKQNLLIKKVLPETDIVYFKTKFNVPQSDVKVYEDVSCTNEVTSGIVATEMAVKIVNTSTVYRACVIGDFNNDGKMAEVELNQVIKHVAGLQGHKLTGLDLINADVNYDGKVDQIDITIMIRWIVYKELDIPAPPIIEVVSGDKDSNGTYISDVTVRIREGNNAGVEVQKTTYSINYGEEIEIKSGGTITLTKNGEYKIIAYTYLEEGIRSRSTLTIKIERSMDKVTVNLDENEFTYDGTAKEPAVTVKDGTKTLVKDVTYTVSYSNNINAGTATVTITGKGGYTGSKTANFTINPKTINVVANAKSIMYGEAIPKLDYTYSGVISGQTAKFTGELATSATTSSPVGTYDITIGTLALDNNGTFLASNYKISYTKASLTITSKDTSTLTVTLSENNYTYDGTAKEPFVTVTDGGKTLVKDVNYTVSYSNNINAGTAIVTVTGKDGYTGTRTASFTINPKTINVVANAKSKMYGEVIPKLDYTYSGVVNGQTAKFTGNLATSATANSSVGTYDITIGTLALDNNGTFLANNYTISYTKASLSITSKDVSTLTATLSENNYTYDGTAKTPSVTVKDGSTTLALNVDYTVSYSSNTNAGTATVTITGKDNYSGTKILTFIINKATNPISVVGKTGLNYTGSSQELVTVTNAEGTVYYSTNTVLTSGNYASGSTSIPTAVAVGNYTVYYYTPGNNNYAEKNGSVSASILESIAQIGTTIYPSIQSAVNAVPTNNVQTTITMLKSTTESVNIPNNKNVLLDLANYTVTGDSSNSTFASAGILTVKGGTLTSASQTTIYNAGILNIIDTANITNTSQIAAIYNESNATTTIVAGTVSAQNGNTIINNGTAEISGTANIINTTQVNGNLICPAVYNQTNSTLKITGGTISATYKAVANFGTAKITAGTIYSQNGRTISNEQGILEISGSASIKNTSPQALPDNNNYMNTIANKSTLKITGGTILAENANAIVNEGTVEISGSANISNSAPNTNNIYYPAIYGVQNSTVTITGGTVVSNASNAIYVQGTLNISGTANITSNNITVTIDGNTSTLNMTGGTITSTGNHALYIMNTGSVIISGGTIDGRNANYAIYKESSCTGTVSINGATIYGNRYGV